MQRLSFFFLLFLGYALSENTFLKDSSNSHVEHHVEVANVSDVEHEHQHEPHGVKVVSFKFEYVLKELVITVFILVVGLFKLGYHHTRYLQRFLPESCCLILVGVFLGFCFLYDSTHESVKFLEFDSRTFFFMLLPPIILESAYSLKDRAFLDNLGTILLYAVVGTVLNIVIIGGGLISLSEMGLINGFYVDPLDCLIFASLIAAVDPVAVLAIFQEVGVNKILYFMVFGESLLNDAVTVVCYNLMIEFKQLPEIRFVDCMLGVIAFIFVACGGLFIGLFFGVISAFVTKYTLHVRVVEPVILFGTAYLSFVVAEMFHFSGLIALIACGLFQTHYTCGNISYKSYVSVTYFAKVASSVAESLIFIILGVMLVNEQSWFWSEWHPLFSIYALVLCQFARVLVVFLLTYIVNRYTGGVRYISLHEQLIMAYGGLRGAISFSLVFMISDTVPTKNTLLSATYIIILFTVFLQGSTIKPIVKYLKIRLARKEDNFRMFNEFNRGMISHMAQGFEDLCGKNKSLMNTASELSKEYIRPTLQRAYNKETKKTGQDKLLLINREEQIKEHMRKSASTQSFIHQETMEQMAEEGEISRGLLDDDEIYSHQSLDQTEKEEIERKTEEILSDNVEIGKLISGNSGFYVDRNLTGTDDMPVIETVRTAKNAIRMLQERARNMEQTQARRRIFNKTKKNNSKNTTKGLLLASMGSLGVHSIDAGDEDVGLEIQKLPELYTIDECAAPGEENARKSSKQNDP